MSLWCSAELLLSLHWINGPTTPRQTVVSQHSVFDISLSAFSPSSSHELLWFLFPNCLLIPPRLLHVLLLQAGSTATLPLAARQTQVSHWHSRTPLWWLTSWDSLVYIRNTLSTYNIAIPQCLPALSPAAWKPERPMRATVGVMVRGPMYRSRAPGRPSKPITTSISEDMIIAPWIWTHKKGKETVYLHLKSETKTFLFLLWITNCSSKNSVTQKNSAFFFFFVIKQLIRFKWLIA